MIQEVKVQTYDVKRYSLLVTVFVTLVLSVAVSPSTFTVTTVTVYCLPAARPVNTNVVVPAAGVSVFTTVSPSLTVTLNFVNVPVVGAVHATVNPVSVTELTETSVTGSGSKKEAHRENICCECVCH